MNVSILQKIIDTMDDKNLKYYLREHSKRLVNNERNYRNSIMMVEELKREADRRGIK